MTTKVSDGPGSLDVSSWLAELHMECYKKHLEDYETIKPLLELRESDIKKLGVSNSKDRTRMMNSLASYRGIRKQDSTTPSPGSQVTLVQETQKMHRKPSLKKLNIKSFLTSGSSKKNKSSKKSAEVAQQISDLSLSARAAEDSAPTPVPPPAAVLPPPPSTTETKPLPSSALADYEELPDVVSPLSRSMTMDPKAFHVPYQSAVENEYVPSPENSPKFGNQRHRANTIATPLNPDLHYHYPLRGGVASLLQPSQHSAPELVGRQQGEYISNSTEDDSPGPLTHKHLSIVSMESGLSFGYDVEKDFNPSQPLESQPWYHGKITRGDAEALLHDDGDFLVRENTTMSNTYTLTLRWRGVADHTLIGTTEVISTTSFIRGSAVKYQFDSGAFDSIPELIFNHLKYQIPVDTAQHTLITNPVCRPGNPGRGGGMYNSMAGYAQTFSHRTNLSPESSPSYSGTGSRHSGSPSELPRLRLAKSISTSTTRDSASPPRDRLSKHLSVSSGDLLESSLKEEFTLSPRNVISPPPDTRARAMTISHSSARQSGSSIGSGGRQVGPPVVHGGGGDAGNHQRVDSFGDYEVMESVSILNDSPTLGTRTPHPPQEGEGHLRHSPMGTPTPHHRLHEPDYSRAMSVSAGNSLNRPRRDSRERVKYAEIRYPRDGGPGVIINPKSSSVNYAEVRFQRSNTVSTPSQAPHPFALYDIVPPGRREATPPYKQETSPYQSRADVLANRTPSEPTYSIPNPSANSRRPAAHPISNYATIQFPAQSSATATHGHASSTDSHSHTSNTLGRAPQVSSAGIPVVNSQVPIKQTDTTLYALPDKSRLKAQEHSPKGSRSRALGAKSRELSSSNDSLLSNTSSTHSASPAHKRVIGSSLVRGHSHSTSAKVHKDLPGYEALVKVHTLLQNHSNDELAYHMTRTDAVCFMLAPRPAEDRDIWKERVKQVTSSSGMFCGLQTLADPDGEKLWKKLYFRHLNLSQTVTLTIVTAGDALERAKLLHRFIDVAQLLQCVKYGNLFSFVAVMQGLASPQLGEMSEVWDLLNTHYPSEAALYKTLQSTVAAIDQGETALSLEHLTIPPIQQLKSVFRFTEQNMVGFPPVHPDHSIVGEFMSLAAGHACLRLVVANTAAFTLNAWRSLEKLQYNVNLMEFLMQDFTRVYLQSINVHSDSPLERRRRFGLLMDALIDRVESSETV